MKLLIFFFYIFQCGGISIIHSTKAQILHNYSYVYSINKKKNQLAYLWEKLFSWAVKALGTRGPLAIWIKVNGLSWSIYIYLMLNYGHVRLGSGKPFLNLNDFQYDLSISSAILFFAEIRFREILV